MKLETVKENLANTYLLFKDFILDKNYEEINNCISWRNYITGIPKIIYSKEYENLIEFRQFSLMLIDRSIIQIFYYFDNKGLNKVKLAYYPVPKVIQIEKEEVDNYFQEAVDDALLAHYNIIYDLVKGDFELTNSTHIRLDFDREVKTHEKNHMQIGGINDVRFPFYSLILPFSFVDFIIKSVFPKEHSVLKLSPEYKYIYADCRKKTIFDSEQVNDTSLHLYLHN